jgi:hypothetical protein
MKRLLVLLTIVLTGVSSGLAQGDTQYYTGDGISFQYPVGWFVFESEDSEDLTLSNGSEECSTGSVKAGVICVELDYVEDSRTSFEEQSTEYRIMYSMGAQTAFFALNQYLSTRLSDVEIIPEQIRHHVGLIEYRELGGQEAVMLRADSDVLDSD